MNKPVSTVATASSAPVSTRYHSLDALRAIAMLLGIVLHAAWIMYPSYLMTPISDVSGNYFLGYVFHLIHMFRMQVFFLIAGFFACLVLRRNGSRGFIRHRLVRVGFPLLLFWLLLLPWVIFYYVWGGLESGRLVTDEGFWPTFKSELISTASSVDLIHLWFLYYLLLLYALTVMVRAGFKLVIDRQGKLRERIDRLFAAVIHSRLNVLWLAVPSAALLWWGSTWYGISFRSFMLIPDPSGLLGYWVFFGVGWLIYSQSSLLTECTRRWRLHLTLGLLLSLPLFATIVRYVEPGRIPLAYPMMILGGIADYSGMRSELLASRDDQTVTPRQIVWNSITPARQAFIEDHESMTNDQLAGLEQYLSVEVILNPSFYNPADWKGVDLPPDAASLAELPVEQRSFGESMLLNRKLLEAALPGHVRGDVMDQSYFRNLRIGFACLYGVVMWLLVFGFMGLFMHYFAHPSERLRYIADSSYWLYLLHLPILFQIEVWIAGIPMNWILKFLIYNLAAIAVLVPSYHYLVRSTFIGTMLNGRKYPFRPWFFGPSVEAAATPQLASVAVEPDAATSDA